MSRDGGDGELLHGALVASLEAHALLMPGARIDVHDGCRVVISPSTPFPQYCGPWIEDPGRDGEIVGQLAGFVDAVEREGLPCWIQLREGRTPLAEAQAVGLGFTERVVMLGMIMRPADLIEPGPNPDLAVIQAADTEDAQLTLAVAAAGFGVPKAVFAPFYTCQAVAHPGARIYLGSLGGLPATSCYGWRAGDTLGIYAVATPPRYRRRGCASQVVCRAVKDGFAAGTAFAYLQASPMGSSVYERLGFRTVERYLILSRPATT